MLCDYVASSKNCLAATCGQAVLFWRCGKTCVTFAILSPNDPSSIRANAKPVTACSDRTSGSDEHPVTLLSLQPRTPLWDSFLDSPNAIGDQQLTNEIVDSAAPQAWLASISLHLVSCEALDELVQWLARLFNLSDAEASGRVTINKALVPECLTFDVSDLMHNGLDWPPCGHQGLLGENEQITVFHGTKNLVGIRMAKGILRCGPRHLKGMIGWYHFGNFAN